jgi:hypothetical protein
LVTKLAFAHPSREQRVPMLEELWQVRHPVVDFRLQPITYTDQSPEIFGKENLGPGKRRWTRSSHWRGSGRGRWSRRCCCCCCGGGSWRGSRRRSGSGRRGRCTSFHRSKDVDPTRTINVVWRARGSALSRTDVDSRVIQGIAARNGSRNPVS